MHIGDRATSRGPRRRTADDQIGRGVAAIGLAMGRLKTGTPPRLDRRTIDFSRFAAERGDDPIVPFSFLSRAIPRLSCLHPSLPGIPALPGSSGGTDRRQAPHPAQLDLLGATYAGRAGCDPPRGIRRLPRGVALRIGAVACSRIRRGGGEPGCGRAGARLTAAW